ncbi:hypothetical protein SAMN05428949_0642 [Chitinophaga sp. YR627]|uniref:hypothetical protein n=1 Tax=Chitinophaga sp. YR627 TaxID=1881041 RepID=UPI0008ED5BC9|nr:hypothetical protein [Chitinophaga sp. YR627]SFM74493.1 hypothetical protein SAMN05428949_0642 [Chitinophaga sp. YR627]
MNDFWFLANKLEKILCENAEFLYQKLQVPLEPSMIQSFLSTCNAFDPQLEEFFAWKNGIPYNVSDYTLRYDFSSQGVFLPLSFAVSLSDSFKSYGLWPEYLFPLVGNYSGDYLLYDLRIDEPTYGMLFLFSKSALSLDPMMTYCDSITAMLSTIIACFENGAFRYGKEGLDIDFDLMIEINKRNNPASSYWKQF